MDDAEVAAFLDEQDVVTCATISRDGRPHLMPLWYVVREGTLWAWTYRKSQKVLNLRRDARATLQVEAGGGEYGELRGVMIEAEADIHRDGETVLGFAEELTLRYAEGISAVEGDARAALEAQAPKRVAIRFKAVRVASWDHRKLGGTY